MCVKERQGSIEKKAFSLCARLRVSICLHEKLCLVVGALVCAHLFVTVTDSRFCMIKKRKQTNKKTAVFVQSDLSELLYRSITLIFILLSRRLIACKDKDKSFFSAEAPVCFAEC